MRVTPQLVIMFTDWISHLVGRHENFSIVAYHLATATSRQRQILMIKEHLRFCVTHLQNVQQ